MIPSLSELEARELSKLAIRPLQKETELDLNPCDLDFYFCPKTTLSTSDNGWALETGVDVFRVDPSML